MKIVTHNGGFHSDELFAIALLKKYVSKDLNIVRTRDRNELEEHTNDAKSWVIDVGGVWDEEKLNFDHHQSDFKGTWKCTDIEYSSCGLIWNYLRKNNFLKNHSNWVLNEIENRLIKKIDLHDNGRSRWSQAIIFKMFNRGENNDVQFSKALELAMHHLENCIYFINKEEHNRSKLDDHQYLFDERVIVVEDGGFNIIPTISSLTNAKIIIESKMSEEGWSIQSIDSNIETPFCWRGLSGKQLDMVSGLNGLIFAHRSGHLVKARSKNAAIEAARIMLG